MDDRELLELAAKATEVDFKFCRLELGGCLRTDGIWWNPLTDDGDALRLAVNLRISVSIGKDVVEAYIGQSDGKLEASKSNLLSAARRAIVRAAAEIGRQMREGGAA